MQQEPRLSDDGFTLIELLIVIVILGVLSTVTVFAVRGITDKGQENSCAVELRNLSTAQEQNWALNGSYASEADLVANQVITADSSMYDITLAADQSYTIAPAAGSSCTATSTGGGAAGGPAVVPAGPDRTTYTVALTDPGVQISFGSIAPALQYNGGGGNDEVLVFGRGEGADDFLDTLHNAPPTSRRVTFINLNNLADDAAVLAAMNRSRGNDVTRFAVYPDDDPGGAAQAFISSQLGVGPLAGLDEMPLETLDVAPGGGKTLTALLLEIG